MEVVVATAFVIIVLVVLFSFAGSSRRDLTEDEVLRGGRDHAYVAEETAQKARADAIAAHQVPAPRLELRARRLVRARQETGEPQVAVTMALTLLVGIIGLASAS